MHSTLRKIILNFKTMLFITMMLSPTLHALDTIYIYDVKIDIEETKNNSSSWDINGGSPDIILRVNSVILPITKKCINTYSCTLSFLSSAHTFYIEVYDKDIITSDIVGKGLCHIHKPCLLNKSTVFISKRK